MAVARISKLITNRWNVSIAEVPPDIGIEADESSFAVPDDQHLRIDIYLQNIVAEEKRNAKFQCRITGKDPTITWYKNGEPINETNRILINTTEQCQTLEIWSLNITDRGLYTIIAKNSVSHVQSQAVLFVKSENTNTPLYMSTGLVLHMSPENTLSVKKHLKNINIKAGELLLLEAEIEAVPDTKVEYVWTKDNQMYNFLSHGTINERSNIQLIKYDTKIQDSGVYTVVAKCNNCIVCSTSEVIVTTDEIETTNKDLPGFIEQLPVQIEVNERELAVMRCKINANNETEVSILLDEKPIKENTKIIFNRNSVLIIIKKSRRDNAGKYRVLLENKRSGISCESSCLLSVLERPKNTDMQEIEVQKHLNVVYASMGSRIGLYCKFNIPDSKFYYVVWHVGQYKIERNTPQFQVIRRKKDFLLYIKAFELDMEGPVMCQLRQSLHYEESVEVAITEGAIYNVPSWALPQEVITTENTIYEVLKRNTRLKWSANLEDPTILNETSDTQSSFDSLPTIDYDSTKVNSNVNNDTLLEWHPGCSSDTEENSLTGAMAAEVFTPLQCSSPIKSFTVPQRDNLFMEIIYCKLQEEGVHYLMVDEGASELEINFSVREPFNENITGTVTIKWNGFHSLTKECYAIELLLPTDEYAQVGVVSHPEFHIHNPRLELLMRFRIRLVQLQHTVEALTISITSPENILSHFKSTTLCAIQDFDKEYTMLEPVRVLGSGAFGSVVLVKNAKGNFFAMKMIKTWTQRRRVQAMREYRILHSLRHPKVVNLFHAYSSNNEFWLVMDYLWGGELFARIVQEDSFKEESAVGYVKQICEGLEYLHRERIIHLDLKPENVVCVSPNSTEIKIIDYGISRNITHKEICVLYGTREYMAPEVVNYDPLTVNVDMWSLGVMVYVMLSGVFPFETIQWVERSRRVTQALYNYDEPALLTISEQAKDFIDSLLVKEPNSRLSAGEALQHDWLTLCPTSDVDIGKITKWRTSFQSYLANSRKNWQLAGNVVIAINRLRAMRPPPSSREAIVRRKVYETVV